MKESNKLQSEMMDSIMRGGAWFTSRRDRFIKIGYSQMDNCYFARDCLFNNEGMEGRAYSFGLDWFDISFRGRDIDIYSDPDTFRTWEIWYEKEKGTRYSSNVESSAIGKRIIEFCKEADAQAISGVKDSYVISGTNFDFLATRGDK